MLTLSWHFLVERGPGVSGVTLGTFQLVDSVAMTSSALANYTLTLSGRNARYLVMCREAWSATRDDVVIDYVSATCQ